MIPEDVHPDDVAITPRYNNIDGILVPRKGDQSGRQCDFTKGHYVSWDDTITAIMDWCKTYAGTTINRGKSKAGMVSGKNGDYMSGKTKVKLYGML